MCVFYNKDYTQLLSLLLKSIQRFTSNKCMFDVLIITEPGFRDSIDVLQSIFPFMVYYMDNKITLFDAGCARLYIFSWDKIMDYSKILYLDTDVLLNNDLSNIFDVNLDDEKLYAYEEGSIHNNFWGGFLFRPRRSFLRPRRSFFRSAHNVAAFSSGVLLFKNCLSLKMLFNTIKEHAYNYIKSNPVPVCLDQPFICYHAIKNNKYNNKALIELMENNPVGINHEKHIYHFPGGPGHYASKYEKMTHFFELQTKTL
jgi:hypothetical protein